MSDWTNDYKLKRRSPKPAVTVSSVFFGIFLFIGIATILWLIVFSFPGASRIFRIGITGQFKRPMPTNPQLYYDMACINVHDYQTFQSPSQVELCYKLRNANR